MEQDSSDLADVVIDDNLLNYDFSQPHMVQARAAAAAGWRVVVADRPGNKPLPPDHGFRVVTSMHDVLA